MAKILIIDDEKPIAHALTLKLKNTGFDVQTVFDVKTALETIEKEKIDLMILDLVMPQPDGFHLLEELKKRNIHIPVIVSSSLGQEEDIKRAKDLGAKGYLIRTDTPLNSFVEHVKKIVKP